LNAPGGALEAGLERNRRIAATALAAVFGKALSVGLSLWMVRLALRHLGAERYGLWATLLALPGLMSFGDLGLGNGLLNTLSAALGAGRREEARGLVSSAFFALLGLGAAFALLTPWLSGALPWASWLHVEGAAAAAECAPALAVFLFSFALSLPLDVVQRVQASFQEGVRVNAWQLAGKAAELGGLACAAALGLGLPWTLALSQGAGLLAGLFNWGELLLFKPWLLPRPGLLQGKLAARLLGLGGMFLLLQLLSSFSAAADNLLIAWKLSPAHVANYSVAQKLFVAGPLLQSLFLAPLWPAYAEALARKDFEWLRKTLLWSSALSLGICAAAGAALALGGQKVIQLWVGEAVHPSKALLWGCALSSLAQGACGALNIFMNAASRFRFQLIWTLASTALGFWLKFVLAGPFQEAGVAWAGALSTLFLAALPSYLYLPGFFRRLRRES
jgi:O-antigen/teichoic acid export membrane protein